MDTIAIEKYLLQQKIKDEGVTFLAAPIVKGTMKMFPLSRAADDQIVALPHQTVVDDIGGVLKSFAREMLDPARFSADNVTFCALTGTVILRQSTPYLMFVTIRSISDKSTQVLLEVFFKGFSTVARAEIIKFRTYMGKQIGY